jgi:hypothetical protein
MAVRLHWRLEAITAEEQSMKSAWESVRRQWCKAVHPAPMWPVHGFYRCRACWRLHPVPWESVAPVQAPIRLSREVLGAARHQRSAIRAIVTMPAARTGTCR